MEKKQTAIEFLIRELRIEDLAKSEQLSVVYNIILEAKQMERDQINKAFYDGYYQESMYDARSYYDDTYSKDNVK